jgi:DNA-binding CsgD family transcriptional regulator
MSRWAGLLERDREIAALSRALRRAGEGTGAVAVVEGSAGIGKSRLLAAACAQAQDEGMVVLRARGVELERDVSFGLAVELFAPPVAAARGARRERLLAGPAAATGSLWDPAGPEAVEVPALVRGLHGLVANLAAASPVAIAVDDAQWGDRPSLAFLAYLAARVENLPAVLMVAIRSGEPATAEDVLAALRAGPATTRLAPTALSDAAVGRIVVAELPGSEPAFVAACARLAAGNPFLAGELARALRADGVDPTAASVDRLEQLVPASVLHSLLMRLGRLGEDAQRVAEAVAILGDTPLRRVAALAGIDALDAGRAADALAGATILAPGEPLRFAHPLIATAVRADLPAFAAARAHRRAAALLAADGAPVQDVAAHLALSTPEGSAEAVATLRAAAARSLAHGDPQAAAHLLTRAVAEPPPPGDRHVVLLELAHAQALAADPAAEAHAAEALELAGDDPVRRAQALRVLSQVGVALGRREAAAQALRDALAAVGPDEPLGQEIFAEHLTAHRFVSSLLPGAQSHLARIVATARQGNVPAHPGLAAHTVLELAFAGERPELVRRLAEAVSADQAAAAPGVHGMYLGLLIQALCCVDELDAAERIAEEALGAARDQGSFMGAAAGCFHRAIARYHRGALSGALADLEEAQAPFREGWLAGAAWPQSLQAHVQLERGSLDAARATVALTWSAPPPPEAMDHAIARFARARLALAERDPRSARADATAAGRQLADGFGIDHPGLLPWRPTAALAAFALDDRASARALAAEALERARWSGVPRAISVALRAAAVVADDAPRVDLLSEAVEAIEASPSRLERAHALAALGGALLRAGRRRDAQPPLREALALADGMGAAPLVEAVRADLRASGARPRRTAVSGVDSLTPAELRVCRLAAQGLTNRQIAQELFVTGKTVQTHLAHAYRKLDVASRRELPAALAGR